MMYYDQCWTVEIEAEKGGVAALCGHASPQVSHVYILSSCDCLLIDKPG